MLNLILAVMVPFLITTAEEQTASNIEVVEIFRAENTEELEASLTDGYPMPWLEEILNDESIPEEDRYWLDCRVRAVYAQDLHLFFDEEGNPVHVEADWIKYGEYYWQEHFIVNPPGEYEIGTLNHETGLYGEQGFVYNRFGEKTGDLVLCETWMELSRNGSIGLIGHYSSDYRPGQEGNPFYMFFVYSDGSYHMNPETLWGAQATLSQSGEYAMLVIENDPERIQLFNRDGKLLWERSAMARGGTGIAPMILPNDEYCVFPCAARSPMIVLYLQVFNVNNGSEARVFYPENIARTSYSPDGILIFDGEKCVSLETDDTVWSIPSRILSDYKLFGVSCTNNGNYYAISYKERDILYAYFAVYSINGEELFSVHCEMAHRLFLSPNGTFALNGPSKVRRIESSIPFNVWQIRGNQ